MLFAASARATSAAALQPHQEEYKATEFGPVIRSPVVPAEEQPHLLNNVKQHDADRLLEGIERQFVFDCAGHVDDSDVIEDVTKQHLECRA